MDKNTIIGFVLIAAVLFGFAWWQQPSEEQLQAQHEQYQKDSIAAAKKLQEEKTAQAKQKAAAIAAAANDSALFHTAIKGKAQDIVLKNSKLELTFSTKGATVTKAYIKNEKGSKRYVGHSIADKTGKHDDLGGVTLFDGKDQQLNYTLVAKESNISTQDLYFTPTNLTDSTVTFTAEAAPGKTLVIEYKLGKDYLLHSSLKVNGMAGLFDPNASKLNIDWHEGAGTRLQLREPLCPP